MQYRSLFLAATVLTSSLTLGSLLLSSAFAADNKDVKAEVKKAPVVDGNKKLKKTKFVEPNMRLPKDSGGIITDKIVVNAPIDTDFLMGKADAPITIIEYASLSCPHCAHFSANVLPVLKKNYIDAGKANYILRQFPLNEPALKGAILLQCIGEQSPEKYYVFSKVLFDAQGKWAFDSDYMSGLQTIANVGGVSTPQFTSCISNTEREMAQLKMKKQSADALQIPHTPYIIIGNEVYEGERTAELVSRFIDKKLAELSVSKKPE